jgi:hypothetical protein
MARNTSKQQKSGDAPGLNSVRCQLYLWLQLIQPVNPGMPGHSDTKTRDIGHQALIDLTRYREYQGELLDRSTRQRRTSCNRWCGAAFGP